MIYLASTMFLRWEKYTLQSRYSNLLVLQFFQARSPYFTKTHFLYVVLHFVHCLGLQKWSWSGISLDKDKAWEFTKMCSIHLGFYWIHKHHTLNLLEEPMTICFQKVPIPKPPRDFQTPVEALVLQLLIQTTPHERQRQKATNLKLPAPPELTHIFM